MLSGVPTPKKYVRCPPSQYMLSFKVVRCPHPICSTHQECLEALPSCTLESAGTGGGGVVGAVDEMQNKAEAQAAWLQLAAGVILSLAKTNKHKICA